MTSLFTIRIRRNFFQLIVGLAVCSFCLTKANAQNSILHGTVVGAEGEPLAGASIQNLDSEKNAISDRRGDFTIEVDSLSTVEIRYIGYETAFVEVPGGGDTIRKFIQMVPQVESLEEFEVRAAVFKPIAAEDAINVLDFIPYRDFVLTLETRGRQRSLAFYQEPDSVERFLLKRIRGRSLFKDCFGNVHVLTDDSVYQVYVEDQVHIIAAISMEQFQENIESCVADFDEVTFFEGYSRSNKMYSLLGYAPGSKKPECFLSVWDKRGEFLAKEAYYGIISLYYASTIEVENIILNKSWSGDVVALAKTPELTAKIGWYTKVLIRNVEVKTFKTDRGLVAFDCFTDSIATMDHGGKVLTKAPFGDGSAKVNNTIQDEVTDQFFIFDLQGANKGIYSIDLSSGKKELIGSPKGLGRSEMLKVYNGHVYFIIKDEGFGKLYRARLTDLNG